MTNYWNFFFPMASQRLPHVKGALKNQISLLLQPFYPRNHGLAEKTLCFSCDLN